MTPEEELSRAEDARQLLERGIFAEAVKEVEAALLDGIRRTAFTDEKLREKLCQRYALLEDVVGQLRTYIETGRLAEETIKQRTFMERMRQLV